MEYASGFRFEIIYPRHLTIAMMEFLSPGIVLFGFDLFRFVSMPLQTSLGDCMRPVVMFVLFRLGIGDIRLSRGA